jgi:hypothetical protein
MAADDVQAVLPRSKDTPRSFLDNQGIYLNKVSLVSETIQLGFLFCDLTLLLTKYP